jgi:Cu+-exporting ATPase
LKKVLLKIGGMTCSACSSGLEKYLNKQDGVVRANVNLVMNNASIEYDDKKLSLKDIEKFVDKAGFESLGIDNLKKEERKKSGEKINLILTSIFSIAILYVSMAHMIGLPDIPFLSMMEHPLNYAVSLLVLTTVVLGLGYNILKNGIKNLIHGTPNMDTLVTIGVLASFIYSVYETVQIFLGDASFVHLLYYESAAIVIFFIRIGKYVEGINTDKTKEAIQELMTITPNSAVVERDGKEIAVTLDEIEKDDIVICKPGEKVAVDGTVVDGISHINESFITGESMPVKVEAGTKVIAGSINYEGAIKYKAEKIGRESTVSEIVRMVVEATNTKAPISKLTDKVSSVFVPIVITIAIITFIVWLIIGKSFAVALNYFVTVLVVACPCSLGLATPLAIVIASGVCSKKGILVKNSESLENAHKVKTIIFDKTGTLTKGTLSFSKMYNYSDLNDDDIFKIIAGVEKKSEHPIAKAIVEEVEKRNIDFDEVKEFKAISGQGVFAVVENYDVLIGNKRLMDANNISVNESDFDELVNDGNSILYVSLNNKVVALIGVKDVVKENVSEVISSLKKKNINVVMLTGDNEVTAKKIAEIAGIETVVANVMPSQKAEYVEKFKKDGLVMMCGDGINDSVSLVKADIGVSVSSGTDIAMDSAQVVIMNDNLDRINDLIRISSKTIRNISGNLFWAFFYNICMIPIAMGVFVGLGVSMNPMLAALAMVFSSLFVVLNALRLRVVK